MCYYYYHHHHHHHTSWCANVVHNSNNDAKNSLLIVGYNAPPPQGGGIKWWCASDVCLSHTSGLSHTEVAHTTHDSDTTFKVKRSTCSWAGAMGKLWWPPSQLVMQDLVVLHQSFMHAWWTEHSKLSPPPPREDNDCIRTGDCTVQSEHQCIDGLDVCLA